MAVSPMNQAVLALTCSFFMLSNISLFLMGVAQKEGITKRFNRIALMVTTFASLAYLCMTAGFGIAEDVHGHRVYWIRYVDWVFTTPLMLVELGVLAGAKRWQTVVLIVIDEFMLAFGIASSLVFSGKWPFFMMGLLCFAVVAAKLFTSLQKQAEVLGGDAKVLYNFVANRTAEIWCAYPVLFALCECTKTFPEEFEVAGYAVADVLAKCGIPMMVWVSSMSKRSKLMADDTEARETTAADIDGP
ncbi:unnamed protein product [Effrenium voratum]|nr:unnamed protein product [Effrenium voratum]